MKFIVVDDKAADEIVSDRFLQSSEFEAGQNLAYLLKAQAKEISLNPRVSIVQHDSGVYFLSPEGGLSNIIVFDLTEAP